MWVARAHGVDQAPSDLCQAQRRRARLAWSCPRGRAGPSPARRHRAVAPRTVPDVPDDAFRPSERRGQRAGPRREAWAPAGAGGGAASPGSGVRSTYDMIVGPPRHTTNRCQRGEGVAVMRSAATRHAHENETPAEDTRSANAPPRGAASAAPPPPRRRRGRAARPKTRASERRRSAAAEHSALASPRAAPRLGRLRRRPTRSTCRASMPSSGARCAAARPSPPAQPRRFSQHPRRARRHHPFPSCQSSASSLSCLLAPSSSSAPCVARCGCNTSTRNTERVVLWSWSCD